MGPGLTPKACTDELVESHGDALLKRLSIGVKGLSGKDGRLFILYVGSKEGFLPGCELLLSFLDVILRIEGFTR